jgi:predicted flap endonuclease-1-like 5' DNA nuclease
MIMKSIVLEADKKDRSWFWWGINIGVLLALGLWWWLDKQSKAATAVKVQPLVLPQDDDEVEQPVETTISPVAKQVVKEPDNLKVIEGIGPRSAQVLADAGVLTFSGLAAMHPDDIQVVLRAAGVRVPYPETWPEQAELAAAEDWEALKDLQGKLKGGRRA